MAVPFTGMRVETQPDGTEIELYTEGDEFFRHDEHNGYAVVFSEETKSYVYARLSDDGTELLPTHLVVGVDDPTLLDIPKHQRITDASRHAKIHARRQAWDVEGRRARQQDGAMQPKFLDGGLPQGDGLTLSMVPPSSETTGLKVGLTILVDFSDIPAAIPVNDMRQFLNADNYTGHSNNGSVKQYFYDVSKGHLTYTNIVVGYIRAPQPRSYYTTHSGDEGINARLLIREVLGVLTNRPDYASTILPTFNALSNDSGLVQALNILYASNGGYNGWPNGLWPHHWYLLSSIPIGNGMRVWDYQITNIGNSPALGIFCHENGHLLCGFKDLYASERKYDPPGVDYCLMGMGAHAAGGKNPVSVCGYLAAAAGWGTVDLLPAGLNSSSRALKKYHQAPLSVFRHQNPSDLKEYFIVEYRVKEGRDAGLPDNMIVAWHINEAGRNVSYPKDPYEWKRDGVIAAPIPIVGWLPFSHDFKWMDGTAAGVSMQYTSRSGDFAYVNVTTAARSSVAVTFDGNNGTPSSQSITQTFCANYVLPSSNPTRTGYAFTGWFTAASGGTQVTASTKVLRGTPHTLYAQWLSNDTTWYVDIARPDDSGNGRSWSTAKRTLQAAVDAAFAGNTVSVRPGTYAPITTANKAIKIQSVNGEGVTSINGGGWARCATLGTEYPQTNTVLTGFTLWNGWASYGGGVCGGTLVNCSLWGNTSVTSGGGAGDSMLINCWLEGNTAQEWGGGAVLSTLHNCTLSGNTAGNGGGASGGSLVNCTLTGNSASCGGGVFFGTLYNCVLTNNTAIQSGGGAFESTLDTCTLTGNAAQEWGGGAVNSTLVGCKLSSNTAGNGGGASGGTLSGCTLAGNTASCGGGVRYSTLYNCVLTNNTAIQSGGGAFESTLYTCTLTGNAAQEYGGGAVNSTLVGCKLAGNTAGWGGGASGGSLVNCTLTGNTANFGGGGSYEGTLNNCIVWGNSTLSGINVNYNNASTFNYSCTTPLPSGAGNIAANPLFVDAANGNFHLQAGSPCMDRGNNAYVATGAVDLDGNPRIVNGWVDMGAYESQAPRTHTRESDVPVPYTWLNGYRPWKGVTDYEALAKLQGANGLFFWESFVAGLNPTDALSKFLITNIVVQSGDGIPAVVGGKDAAATILLDWNPRRADRVYTVFGKTNLTDTTPWYTPTNDATRFFKVEVRMP